MADESIVAGMSGFLHPAGGLRVISDDWLELCEAMKDLAEAYASVDPSNGYLYRQEALGFRGLAAPSTDEELNRLESEADAMKLAWRTRFRQGKNR